MTQPTQIIDPPIGPSSPVEEIDQWITELEQMEKTNEVKLALEQARDWKRWADER